MTAAAFLLGFLFDCMIVAFSLIGRRHMLPYFRCLNDLKEQKHKRKNERERRERVEDGHHERFSRTEHGGHALIGEEMYFLTPALTELSLIP